MKDSGYNTNLAAEYYVLSMLYRMGMNAYLTLGNKKSIDIIVDHGGRISTIDVKGIAGKTLWPMDNFSNERENHFIVLVSFLDKIDNPSIIPGTYIVPAPKVKSLLYHNPNGTRQGIRLSIMKKLSNEYLEAWRLIK